MTLRRALRLLGPSAFSSALHGVSSPPCQSLPSQRFRNCRFLCSDGKQNPGPGSGRSEDLSAWKDCSLRHEESFEHGGPFSSGSEENVQGYGGAGIACWLERRTRDRKVASSISARGGEENFLLQSQLCVLTLIRCAFHPVLPQWHVKDPGHSAKSADGR